MSFNGQNFSDANDIRIGQNQISALYFKSKKIWPRDPEDFYLVLTSEEDNNDFYFKTRSANYTKTIEVSYNDGKTWQSFTSTNGDGTYIGTLDAGERLCIRGLNDSYADYETNVNYYHTFVSDGKFAASGNIMGLIYGKESDQYGASFPSGSNENFIMLFKGSKVTDISGLKLPATTLTYSCYGQMFANCDNLIRAYNFKLPATTLTENCYLGMFTNCDKLLDAPILPATTLATRCYQYMFQGCSSLNYIQMLATDISATDCLDDWVANVAPTGIFVKDYYLASIPINSVDGIPVGWIYEEKNVPDFYNTDLTIQSLSDNNTITYSGTEELLYRGINQEVFQVFDNAYGVTLNTDDVIIFRAERGVWVDPTGGGNPNGTGILAGHFATTGNFRIFGNIASLNYDSTKTAFYRYVDGTEVGLFGNCTGLISARYLMMPYTQVVSDGYKKMFYGCTNLVEAPQIEATIFGNSACAEMFRGCTSLTVIRQMQVDTTAAYSHSYMYYGCKSVKIIPKIVLNDVQGNSYQYMFAGDANDPNLLISASRLQLPSTTAQYAYRYMFKNCTHLEDAPVSLNAQISASSWACYSHMFMNCVSLKKPPLLPSTTLENECYDYMFYNCQALEYAPELPATVMKDRCYRYMFYNCKFTEAPYLPATELQTYCYEHMFYNCTNLTYINCAATNAGFTDCLKEWVKNVASSGTFVKDPDMNDFIIDSDSGIPVGWTIMNPTDYKKIPLTIVATEGNTDIKFALNWDETHWPQSNHYLYLSTDNGTTWTTYCLLAGNTRNNVVITLQNAGSKILVRGDRTACMIWASPHTSDGLDHRIRVYGNLMSMFYDTNFENQTVLLDDYCCENMFQGAIIDNLIMPATTLTKGCYKSMFYNAIVNCDIHLTATTLTEECYYGMFEGTTVNGTIGSLPATIMQPYCYAYMFAGHQSNRWGYDRADDVVLPATTLATGCYNGMFRYNRHLTVAPDLPATTLQPYCYAAMFQGCTNISKAPLLPATVLVEGCYRVMFDYSGVKEVTVLAEVGYNDATYYWLGNVPKYGRVNKTTTLFLEQDSPSGIPVTWSSSGAVSPETEYFSITSRTDNNNIVIKAANANYTITLWTSTDKRHWTKYTSTTTGTVIGTLNNTETLYITRGEFNHGAGVGIPTGTGDPQNDTYVNTFTSSGNFDASGNIMSLVWGGFLSADGNSEYSGNTIDTVQQAGDFKERMYWLYWYIYDDLRTFGVQTNFFRDLFKGSYLVDASQLALPLRKLKGNPTDYGTNCYFEMFINCARLTAAPQMPATEVGQHGFDKMFEGCTSLTTAPSLNITSLSNSCCNRMFYKCSALTTPPSILPATTLADSCYSKMFYQCSALTTAPTLPATTLVYECYARMFYQCTSLTTAPTLPALTLATACYSLMFNGCSKLNYIKAFFTDTPSGTAGSPTYQWMYKVASTGTFVKNKDATWTNVGVYAVPSKWTVEYTFPWDV